MAKPRPVVKFHKDSPVSPPTALAEQFVEEGKVESKPAPLSPLPSRRPVVPLPSPSLPAATFLPEGRKVTERKDGRRMRRTTIYMEESTAQRVAMAAARRSIDQTAIIKAALEAYLSSLDE